MDHTGFFRSIKSGQISSLYLMEGEEEYIKGAALEALEQALIPADLLSLNKVVLENPSVDELIAAAETLPFLSEKRLVIVKDCAFLRPSKAKDEDKPDSQEEPEADGQLAKMCDYLSRVAPTACLVFIVKGKADKRKKLYLAIKKQEGIVTFSPLEEAELNRWIMQTMRNLGKEISPENAARLAFTVGKDAGLLRTEMEKLAAYAAERQEILEQDIQGLATKSLEASVFDMVDDLVDGKTAHAFSLFENMIRTGGNRFAVLAMILRQYRILFHLKAMQEARVSPADIRNRLGIPPFAVDRAMRQARGYTLAQLDAAVKLCADTEFAIKSGRMAEQGAVERAMLHLEAIRLGEAAQPLFMGR